MRRISMTAVLLFALTACRHFRAQSIPTCPDRGRCEFEGLQDALARSKTVHLLIVHGMGPHEIGYSRTLVKGLVKELRLVPAGGGGIRRIPNPQDCSAQAVLSIRRYSADRGGPQLLIYEVTWSPVIDALKQALNYDSDPEKTSQRARINRSLKQHLINERLADPILYVGYKRQSMQYPVYYTMCEILGGVMRDTQCVFDTARNLDFATYPTLSEGDTVAVVTFSLGSKITFDALGAIMQDKGSGANVQQKLRGKLSTVFMLANQLPLLELADRDDFAAGTIPIAEIGRQLRANDQGVKPAFTVVAISDPNDLLSYDISDSFALLAPEIQFVNLNVRLSPAYFRYVENPLNAHTHHDQSTPVIKYIAHGSEFANRP